MVESINTGLINNAFYNALDCGASWGRRSELRSSLRLRLDLGQQAGRLLLLLRRLRWLLHLSWRLGWLGNRGGGGGLLHWAGRLRLLNWAGRGLRN